MRAYSRSPFLTTLGGCQCARARSLRTSRKVVGRWYYEHFAKEFRLRAEEGGTAYMAAEATALGITTNKAGFWIRTFAYIIDGIGVGIVSSAISSIVIRDSTASSGLNLLLGLAYFAYFWSA